MESENAREASIFTLLSLKVQRKEMSNAVGLERISRVVGYMLTKGNFQNTTSNLPMRVAIIGEANTANQSGLDTDEVEITSAQQAGNIFGFGSPIYNAMRILRPQNGGGLGGIPTVVYAQAAAGGATARIQTITAVGVATGNGTHTLKICGRDGLDGQFYNFTVVTGDTSDIIAEKMRDAINAVLGSPVSATATEYETIATTKWTGLTAQDVNITVEQNGLDLGITYAVAQTQAATGTPSITASLNKFGNKWNTIVVNTYGTVTAIMNSLESFNGVPDATTPTGRFTSIVMKPFIALTGSVAADPSSITSARKTQVTIAICPAPLSAGLPMEAAANMCVLFAPTVQNTPHLDVAGRTYPDMPTPSAIGIMDNYEDRDALVKKGCSTVDLNSGFYRVQDFVTTYHPDGELPPQFRYCRNLMIDFNVRYQYYLLEQIHVTDHAIAADNDNVNATNVIKPKQWKGILNGLAENLAASALIVDASFMQASITVDLSTDNPDRLNTFFRYKRSGFARISSTVAEAGFNFG